MYKFYWNNLPRTSGGGVGLGGQPPTAEGANCSSSDKVEAEEGGANSFSSSSSLANGRALPPKLPTKCGVTVKVRDEESSEASAPTSSTTSKAETIGGSHRVLLRLRRISSGGGGRPKSEVSEDMEQQQQQQRRRRRGQQQHSPPPPSSTMKTSRSTHFPQYNKTWNERSLTKFCDYYSEESFHDYENVYSGGLGDEDDDYDYDYDRSSSTTKEVCPDQLSCKSSASKMSGRKRFLMSMVRQGRMMVRKEETASASACPNNSLYRSKSCERPKMREAIRGMQQNLNRLSSNLAERVTTTMQQQQQHRRQNNNNNNKRHRGRRQKGGSQMSHSMSSCVLSSSSSSNGGLAVREAEDQDEDFSSYAAETSSFCHMQV